MRIQAPKSSNNLSGIIKYALSFLALLLCTSSIKAQSSTGISSTVTFAGLDTATQGNWQGKYGADGYAIANSNQSVPSYAVFAPVNQSNYTWAASTADKRALQTVTPAGRIASTWFSGSEFGLDVNLTDGKSHQVEIYALDWDGNFGRSETVQVVDANTNTVLDSRSVSAFSNGIYLVWNITGHVRINATMTSGANPVISGIFFGNASTSTTTGSTTGAVSSFVGLDTATQGNWQGKYGADGYAIINSNQSLPSYAVFAPVNQSNYTWSGSTTDPRALETVTPAGRIASCWYSGTGFSLDVNLTDGKSHQVAIYALDWDGNFGRSETVQVVDANTNAVLDTRGVSAFSNGIYLVWNVTGHVRINTVMKSGANAVISGIFFGTAGQGQLSLSPTTLNIGTVNVGATVSRNIALTNSGNAPLSITQISATGTGLSTSGATLPLSLAPGQSSSFSVNFASTAAGSFLGSVTITSNSSSSPTTIPVAALEVAIAPAITSQPVSQTVAAGQSATFSVASTGSAPIAYQWMKSGAAITGATGSSYTTPATVSSNNGSQFSVSVSNAAGTAVSNAATLTVTTPTLILTPSASSVNFGSVTQSSNNAQTLTLTNTGTGAVTISSTSVSGAGFNASGIPSGTILSSGQAASLTATFSPAGMGAVSGSISVASNATNGAIVITLSGTGTAPVSHSVDLSWSPSTSTVVGYNVYASTVSGSGYQKLTSSPVPTVSYVDAGLDTAQTRYYVVTSVDSNNDESEYSNQVSAIVP